MSLQPQLFSILRERRTGDGAGGKIVVLSSDRKRYQGTINRRRSQSSDERLEEGKHNATGPGVQEATRRIVCFRAPFPKLVREDRLVGPDGVQYTIHHLRPYDWSLQVDCEAVV